MDEAMHPLTILAVGLYGKTLMNQNGAPLRLVVPWKYGFKSIKSIVRIRFTDKQPRTAWQTANPGEYGFYSNVNPEVDHPRWSQARERRLPRPGTPADADVQRLRRPGRVAVRRHGSPEELTERLPIDVRPHSESRSCSCSRSRRRDGWRGAPSTTRSGSIRSRSWS